MGNIPLPALDVRPPAPAPDPLAEYGKVLQLKSLLAQQSLQPGQLQLQQEALTGQRLANQRSTYDIESQKIINKSYADAVKVDPDSGKPTFDTDAITKNLAAGGRGSAIPGVIESLTKMQQAGANLQEAKGKIATQESDYVGHGAYAAHLAGDDPGVLTAMLTHAVGMGYQTAGQALQVIQADPSKSAAVIKHLMGNSPDVQKLLTEKTAAEARATAANVSSQRLQAELPGGPLSEARRAEDRVPAAVETEVKKAEALAPTLPEVTKTTGAGRSYADLTSLKGPGQQLLISKALQAGTPVVTDPKIANILTDVDTARMNLKYMMDTIGSKLASGGAGRIWTGPANTLEKLMQTDPDLAATGTYRSAAIQAMRTVAGSQGLRINKAEIDLAINNDIPKPTDTLPAAQAKLRNMYTFMDNLEAAHLTKNRQVGTGTPGQAAAGGADPIGAALAKFRQGQQP